MIVVVILEQFFISSVYFDPHGSNAILDESSGLFLSGTGNYNCIRSGGLVLVSE